MESLIQKEYESCTLHLIFFSNLGSRNNLWEKKKEKKKGGIQCFLHVSFFFFSFVCRTLHCGPNSQNICFGNSTFREVESVTARSSYVSGSGA